MKLPYVEALEIELKKAAARIEALEAALRNRQADRIEALRAALREVLMTSDPYGVECICREALDKDDRAGLGKDDRK